MARPIVDKVHRADHVGVDEVVYFTPILIEEGMAEPPAGISDERVYRTAGRPDCSQEPIIAIRCSKVCPHAVHALRAGTSKVFAEAKNEGFDVKILKEIIKLRKQDKEEREEHETLLDVYMRAMDSHGGMAKAA